MYITTVMNDMVIGKNTPKAKTVYTDTPRPEPYTISFKGNGRYIIDISESAVSVEKIEDGTDGLESIKNTESFREHGAVQDNEHTAPCGGWQGSPYETFV